MDSVEPENARGPDTVAVKSEPVPLPTRRPESVVEPVPPFATGSIPVRLFTPMDDVAIILPLLSVARTEFVSEVRYVLPLTVNAVVDAYGSVFGVVEVEVMAPEIPSAPLSVSPPVMVDDAALTKIPLLKPMSVEVELPQVVGVNGKICASELDEILLLKVVQSAEVRKPLAEAEAA